MKKILSVFLTFAMMVSLSSVAVAAERTTVSESDVLERQIQKEIQQMEDVVWADLHDQLEAQDALNGFEYFQAALRPEIEQTIYRKYDMQCQAASADSSTYSFNFPNGGLVFYDGDLNTENAVLWMVPEQTYKYWYDQNSVSYVDYIKWVVGFVPGVQLIALLQLQGVALRHMAEREIEEANMYAKLLYISWGGGAEGACYGYGWTSYPKAEVYNAVRTPDVYDGCLPH